MEATDMRNKMVRRWALAAFVAAGAVGALGSGADAADDGRAFRGTADGAITGATSPVDLIVDYTGNGTHLGNFTRHELIHINDDGTIEGTITFFSIHGDIDVDVAGQFTALDGSSVAGTYTITGGEGRFAGATGTAEFTGTIVDGVVSVSFEGTIDY
jgi:hypothetical protein